MCLKNLLAHLNLMLVVRPSAQRPCTDGHLVDIKSSFFVFPWTGLWLSCGQKHIRFCLIQWLFRGSPPFLLFTFLLLGGLEAAVYKAYSLHKGRD